MVAPIAAAALMMPWLLTHPSLFAPNVSSEQAALFLGSAITLTAFPMLARIIVQLAEAISALVDHRVAQCATTETGTEA